MRTATTTTGTILGLIGACALTAACSHDASGDGDRASLLATNGTAVPATLSLSSAPPPVADLTEPALGPVAPEVAKQSWQDGVARFGDGDYAGAVGSLKTAVAGAPDDAYRRYLLGLALWKTGDLAASEAALIESVTLDATRLKTWVNLARVRNERGDRQGAVEAADKALDLEPSSADALHQKGRALSELGRVDEALAALTSARELEPDNGYVANTLGLLLIQAGRPGDAVAPLEVAKARLPHVAFVRNNLGVAYERTGRVGDAKIEYQAAVDAGDMGGKAMKSLVRLGATDTTGSEPTAVAATTVAPPETK